LNVEIKNNKKIKKRLKPTVGPKTPISAHQGIPPRARPSYRCLTSAALV
jgi:hypothetical protein